MSGMAERVAALSPSAHVVRARWQYALESMGWELLTCEIDLACAAARIELRCGDRHVTLDAREGRASITRERRVAKSVAVGRRGDRFLAERVGYELIGRTRHEGVRSALRHLCSYVASNGTRALPPGAVRGLLAPVMALSEVRP